MDSGKAKKWIDRRSSRAAQRTARSWGRERGLEGKANPLMFQNKAQHDRIAAFLAAAAAADRGPSAPDPRWQGPVTPQHPAPQAPAAAPQYAGPAGPMGQFRPYDGSSQYETSMGEWGRLGEDLGDAWDSVSSGWGERAGRWGNGWGGNPFGGIGRTINRWATQR